MATSLEDLKVLGLAEGIADSIWGRSSIGMSLPEFVTQLTALARQLNAFARSLKSQRHSEQPSRTLKEVTPEYVTWAQDNVAPLFADEDLEWLQAISNLQSLISNLQSLISSISTIPRR